MSNVITIVFRRPKLPRRLLNDGWWLDASPIRPKVIVFPKRITPRLKPAVRHLTLVKSEK